MKASVAIIIATKGRSDCIRFVLDMLMRQSCKPDLVVFAVTGTEDLPGDMNGLITRSGLVIKIVTSPAGSATQRNAGMEAAAGTDIVIFSDDDFLMAQDWIEKCAALFAADARLAGLSGHLLKDGATGKSLTWKEAQDLIAEMEQSPAKPDGISDTTHTYGCNMAFRASLIHDIRFDERLVLYGWMEDRDFSRRVAQRGLLVRARQLIGVHLGARRGRVSGRKFGYSQVVNPIYLARKKTLPWKDAFRAVIRPVLANFLKSFHPEPNTDRFGRLVGNLIGLGEIASMRCRPERAAKL